MGMRYLYAALMLAYMVSAVINGRFLRETARIAPRSIGLVDLPKVLRSAYSGIPEMLRGFPVTLRALGAVVILEFMVNAIAGPFWVVYAVEHIGLSRSQWGLALLCETALRNLINIPAGMIVDRFGRTRFALGALVLSLFSLPLFIFARGFWAVVAIRSASAVSTAFFVPACSALMADTVPRESRGRVMAAIGRGSVMIGASSGGTGGPGLGYMVTIPLMITSFSAGHLYSVNPALPWYLVFGLTAMAIALSLRCLSDPKEAEV
jgi:MFS family permease